MNKRQIESANCVNYKIETNLKTTIISYCKTYFHLYIKLYKNSISKEVTITLKAAKKAK